MSGKSVEDEYALARYKDGRWDFFSELIDYRERPVTPQYSGAKEVIAQCPKCGKNGLVKRAFPLHSVYVHVDAKEQNRKESLKICAITRRSDGLINAGDI